MTNQLGNKNQYNSETNDSLFSSSKNYCYKKGFISRYGYNISHIQLLASSLII